MISDVETIGAVEGGSGGGGSKPTFLWMPEKELSEG
jgi:hypothetical protein